MQHNLENKLLLVSGEFSLDMSAVPTHAEDDDVNINPDDAEGEQVAEINFNLHAIFKVQHKPDEPFTESELNAFGQTTGQFALYPYAREPVAGLTGRMGLPPLHLGVMRLRLETRDG